MHATANVFTFPNGTSRTSFLAGTPDPFLFASYAGDGGASVLLFRDGSLQPFLADVGAEPFVQKILPLKGMGGQKWVRSSPAGKQVTLSSGVLVCASSCPLTLLPPALPAVQARKQDESPPGQWLALLLRASVITVGALALLGVIGMLRCSLQEARRVRGRNATQQQGFVSYAELPTVTPTE
eukprot:PLAT9477.2.p1 GENE.PLAT9477.2~~PLAT9477.2.p1  ORF type:complete len:190 (-),score=40.45 PLAT9477.2:40-585(-)